MEQPCVTVNVISSDVDVLGEVEEQVRSLDFDLRCHKTCNGFFKNGADINPGCILLDTSLPIGTGTELLADLSRRDIPLPVIVLSAVADPKSIVETIRAGAVDFIPKPFDIDRLLGSIQEAISENIRRYPDHIKKMAFLERLDRLTGRERQVMAMLIEGANGKEIAKRLEISPRTVEHHRSHILTKTGSESLTQLVYSFGLYQCHLDQSQAAQVSPPVRGGIGNE